MLHIFAIKSLATGKLSKQARLTRLGLLYFTHIPCFGVFYDKRDEFQSLLLAAAGRLIS